MKKAILIISILSIIFLTGCGFFNATNWVCPGNYTKNSEFMDCVNSLDTPEKIGNYMLNNFIYEKHLCYAPNPYSLWISEKGDCNDFSTFGSWVAHQHGYITYQIKIIYSTTNNFNHMLAVYLEGDKLSYTNCQFYFYGFNNFEEIVDYDCNVMGEELKEYIVYNYENKIVAEGYK